MLRRNGGRRIARMAVAVDDLARALRAGVRPARPAGRLAPPCSPRSLPTNVDRSILALAIVVALRVGPLCREELTERCAMAVFLSSFNGLPNLHHVLGLTSPIDRPAWEAHDRAAYMCVSSASAGATGSESSMPHHRRPTGSEAQQYRPPEFWCSWAQRACRSGACAATPV